MIQRRIVMAITSLIWLLVPARAMPEDRAMQPVATREALYTLAPFGAVHLYRPAGEPRGTLLLLSGHDGWSPPEAQMAQAFTRHGMLVAGISGPRLLHALETGPSTCINPNYALIALARDAQHRAGLQQYHKPILLGHGAGGALAYGALAQWPDGSYQGVTSVDAGAVVPGRKPWCPAPGFSARRTSLNGPAWQLAPNRRNRIPWILVQDGQTGQVAVQTQRIVSAVPGARLIRLPPGSDRIGWAQLASVVTSLLPPPPPAQPVGQFALPDMPLTLVPATRPGRSDLMAIAYSGDGGWVGIDRDLAARIAAAGIPVVGVDSLAYFWTARTPQGAGRDLAQLIRAFGQRWNKRRILLVGYSFGADALPYIVDNLDMDARSRIDSVALLGLSGTADFQFHLSSWLDIDSADARPTIPAIRRMQGIALRCVRGQAEADSACPAIPPGLAQQFVVPGDHHFNRNTALLARIILGQRKPGFVVR